MRVARGSIMSIETTAVFGSPTVKRMPRMPAHRAAQLGVRHRGPQDRTPLRCRCKLTDRVDGDTVVRHVITG